MKEKFELGTLVVAVLALIQPWVIYLWKKFIQKPQVEIYTVGNLEIGHSTFGPTLALTGTLRTIFRDVFISSIDLLVIRKNDKAQHTFNWLAFRASILDPITLQPQHIELPSGFMLTTMAPYKYNIIFNENEMYSSMKNIYQAYLSELFKVTNKVQMSQRDISGKINDMTELLDRADKNIKEFRDNKGQLSTFEKLGKIFFWEKGRYQLEMIIRTSKPNIEYKRLFEFEINEEQENNLRLNIVILMETPINNYLKQNTPNNNFVYVPLLD